MLNQKVALITGAGKRVGAVTARTLHANGARIIIHYRNSKEEAQLLSQKLNQLRPDSSVILQADLHDTANLPQLVNNAAEAWGRLDILVNNASSFYPTPIDNATEEQWNELFGSNLKAPFFLAQAATPHLKKQRGCIINMVDNHAKQPLKNYPIYCMAKSGLVMMTKVLAKELGPDIRVNAVAPGVVLWPDDDTEFDKATQERIIARTALKRVGTPEDIASTILFLVHQATYITGQVIAVDGGRSLDY